MPRSRVLAAVLLAALVAGSTAACGRSGESSRPVLGKAGDEAQAGAKLGFPAFATKNTTRVGGADATADAAAVAQAVFPAQTRGTRPQAVALVDARSWQAGVAAAALMGPSIRAPALLASGDKLPAATEDALDALRPTGVETVARAQVIAVGDVPGVDDLRVRRLAGRTPAALARAVDRLISAASRRTSDRVVVTTSEQAEFAMPAAAWAAKSGDPVLFVNRNSIPAETRASLRDHEQPRIYLLGPRSAVSRSVEQGLAKLGRVTRISARTPVENAIAFARFSDGGFGWGITTPGHGLVFASAKRPLDAVAAAPLSASGSYGPLLLVDGAKKLPRKLEGYLLDIQPGYGRDPVRGVYNHGWLIGDESVLSLEAQARIDELLEIVPVASADS